MTDHSIIERIWKKPLALTWGFLCSFASISFSFRGVREAARNEAREDIDVVPLCKRGRHGSDQRAADVPGRSRERMRVLLNFLCSSRKGLIPRAGTRAANHFWHY